LARKIRFKGKTNNPLKKCLGMIMTQMLLHSLQLDEFIK